MWHYFSPKILSICVALLLLAVQAGIVPQGQALALPGEPCTSTNRIFDIAFSPNDQYLLASNWSSQQSEAWKARMWEVTTGEVAVDFEYSDVLPENAAYHTRVDFSQDGRYVVMANVKQALLWDTYSGALLDQLTLDIFRL